MLIILMFEGIRGEDLPSVGNMGSNVGMNAKKKN